MFRKIILLFFAMLFLWSCADKEKIEQLTAQNSALIEENQRLRTDYDKLLGDLKKLRENHTQLQFLAGKLKGVKARIVTNYGNIELKFYPEKAPLHVFSFITRAESGFYDGTQFHRVIKGFMIQGGDPLSKNNDPNDDGSGGPIVNIPHEFNDIKHKPGVLSMARSSNVAAGAGCQFFIMHGANPNLDGQYTAFGEVTKGMDVVNEIANVRTYGASNPRLRDHPVKPVVIRRIEVFRYGG